MKNGNLIGNICKHWKRAEKGTTRTGFEPVTSPGLYQLSYGSNTINFLNGID